MKDTIYLVLAGNFNQFISWCEEQNIHPHNRRVIYVRSKENIMGMRPPQCQLVRYGTWFNRTDLSELEREISLNFPNA